MTVKRNTLCCVKGCHKYAEMVYLCGCSIEHVDEYIVCAAHAYDFWRAQKTCEYGHKILEKMIRNTDGTEMTEPKYYAGEWVLERDGKVIEHGNDPSILLTHAKANQYTGTIIYKVEEE